MATDEEGIDLCIAFDGATRGVGSGRPKAVVDAIGF
jgi:hypothetical protein